MSQVMQASAAIDQIKKWDAQGFGAILNLLIKGHY
jgi:hypothetical protein